jgi:hypothetical protein
MVSQAVGGGQQDVQYFRHQVVPLMQMQPEQDVPPLLLGLKVKRTAAATMLCLAGPSAHGSRFMHKILESHDPNKKTICHT